jgi:preprotein translocase subunit SecG
MKKTNTKDKFIKAFTIFLIVVFLIVTFASWIALFAGNSSDSETPVNLDPISN